VIGAKTRYRPQIVKANVNGLIWVCEDLKVNAGNRVTTLLYGIGEE